MDAKERDNLMKELAEKREALRTFRFDVAGSKKRNVKDARTTKKGIARILTALNMRGQ